MTPEQTQAEKLAEQVIKAFLKDRYNDALAEFPASYDELKARTAIAIHQATEELRAENERLKKEFFDHRQYTIELSRKNADYISSVKTERDQAQREVAALMEAGSAWLKSTSKNQEKAIGLMKNAVYRTQATADAYEARIRTDEREKTVRDGQKKIRYLLKHQNSEKVNWRDDPAEPLTDYWQGFTIACELAEKALLPQPSDTTQGEGG